MFKKSHFNQSKLKIKKKRKIIKSTPCLPEIRKSHHFDGERKNDLELPKNKWADFKTITEESSPKHAKNQWDKQCWKTRYLQFPSFTPLHTY